jgi:hypothetical protein
MGLEVTTHEPAERTARAAPGERTSGYEKGASSADRRRTATTLAIATANGNRGTIINLIRSAVPIALRERQRAAVDRKVRSFSQEIAMAFEDGASP